MFIPKFRKRTPHMISDTAGCQLKNVPPKNNIDKAKWPVSHSQEQKHKADGGFQTQFSNITLPLLIIE